MKLSAVDLWLPVLVAVAGVLWAVFALMKMDAPPEQRRAAAFWRDVFYLALTVLALRVLFLFIPWLEPDHLFFGVVVLSAVLYALYAALRRAGIGTSRRPVNFWRDMFFCFLFVFLLRGFFWDYFRIPSSSMLPTLLVGDVVLVDKNAYGYRLPIVGTRLTDGDEPRRGDIAVFRNPTSGIFYIKRIVGLPGDIVRYGEDKILYVNGEPFPQEDAEAAEGWTGLQLRLEDIPQQGAHNILVAPAPPFFLAAPDGCEVERGSAGDAMVCEVPPENFFTIGDNRDRSNDSRFWGFVPRDKLVGPARRILFNYGELGRIWKSLALTRQ